MPEEKVDDKLKELARIERELGFKYTAPKVVKLRRVRRDPSDEEPYIFLYIPKEICRAINLHEYEYALVGLQYIEGSEGYIRIIVRPVKSEDLAKMYGGEK